MEGCDNMEDMVRCLFGPDAMGPGPPLPGTSHPVEATVPLTTPAQHSPEKVNNPDANSVSGTERGGGTRVDLGTTHYQCAAARNASNKVDATSIATDATFGSVIKLDPETIGSLNPEGDLDVGKTFRGARVNRGGGHCKSVCNNVI